MNAFSRQARAATLFRTGDGQPGGLPRVPPVTIAGTALLLAALTGHFFADGRVTYAAALVFGVCYGPVVLLNFTVAFACYVAVLFVQDVSALSVAPNSMGVLILLGWAGNVITRSARGSVFREQPRLLFAVAMFALWLSLSVLWASSSYDATNGLQDWLLAITAFLVVTTALHSPRQVTIIAVAFIVGAVASVAFGVASGALSAAATGASETALQGRFTGGGGDPNVQAAGFLTAMFLCSGLWSLAHGKLRRAAIVVAFVVVTVGFFATQSRGGLISLALTTIAGYVLLPDQRKRLLGLLGAGGVGLGVIAAVNSGAITRITDVGGGTSGRNDIWTVAWRIFEDHHWVGIGVSNFQALEPHYTLKVGALSRVDLIAEVPHYVHNVYLQMLTEAGVIGLALFLVVIVGSVRASWVAARRFDALGRRGYGDLARAVLMAEVAMLAAQFFISDGEDWRLWILLGLGPVMLSIARRTGREPDPVQAAALRPGSELPVARRDLRNVPRSPRLSAN